MKRLLYILSISLATPLIGCIAEDRSACPQPRGISVRLAVCPDPMTAIIRTTDEEGIRDLNFYLYDDNGNVVLHRYQSSSTLRFECLPGNYLLRIAANMGRDLGENPASEDFTVTHADDYDTLPMSYEGDVTITSSSGSILTLPLVEVQRVVVKVSYEIEVEPADIELRSVQFLSVPRSVSVLDVAARPSDDSNDYTDCPETECLGQQISGTCYLLPNMRGTFYDRRYDQNGSFGRLYTNAPYYLHWGGSTDVFHDVACTSIVFDTSNYPPFVNTTDFYRYAANPVRCVRE